VIRLAFETIQNWVKVFKGVEQLKLRALLLCAGAGAVHDWRKVMVMLAMSVVVFLVAAMLCFEGAVTAKASGYGRLQDVPKYLVCQLIDELARCQLTSNAGSMGPHDSTKIVTLKDFDHCQRKAFNVIA
jgi:hypothetical protein